MKPTLLLMVAVVCLLSCQKDTDQGCPYVNTSSDKQLNEIKLANPVCGEIFKDSLYISLSSWTFDSPVPISGYDSFEHDFSPNGSNGDKHELILFHDYQYLYISFHPDYYRNLAFRLTSGTVVYFDNADIVTIDGNQIWRISLNRFLPNEIIKLRYIQSTEYSLYYHDLVLDMYVMNAYTTDVTSDKEITYKLTPCCNPNE